MRKLIHRRSFLSIAGAASVTHGKKFAIPWHSNDTIPELRSWFIDVSDDGSTTTAVTFSSVISESVANRVNENADILFSLPEHPDSELDIHFIANEAGVDIGENIGEIDPDYVMSSPFFRADLQMWPIGTWYHTPSVDIEADIDTGAPPLREGELSSQEESWSTQERFWVIYPTGYTYRRSSIPEIHHFDHPNVTALFHSATFRHELLGVEWDGVSLYSNALDPDWYAETATSDLVNGLNDLYEWLFFTSATTFLTIPLTPAVAGLVNVVEVLHTLNEDLENLQEGLDGLSRVIEVEFRRRWLNHAQETVGDLGRLSRKEWQEQNPQLATAYAPGQSANPESNSLFEDRLEEYRELLEEQRDIVNDALHPQSRFQQTRDAYSNEDKEVDEDDYWRALHSFVETLFEQYQERINEDLELVDELYKGLYGEDVEIEPRSQLVDFEVTPAQEDDAEEVTITVTADADDTQNDRQSIAVGFPDLEEIDEEVLDEIVSIDDHNLETDEDDMLAPPGTELSANYGEDDVVSEYPLIEGWATDHGPKDDDLYLELTVTLEEMDEDEFRVQAKSIAATEDWQLMEGDPDADTSDTVDQQGEYVYETSAVMMDDEERDLLTPVRDYYQALLDQEYERAAEFLPHQLDEAGDQSVYSELLEYSETEYVEEITIDLVCEEQLSLRDLEPETFKRCAYAALRNLDGIHRVTFQEGEQEGVLSESIIDAGMNIESLEIEAEEGTAIEPTAYFSRIGKVTPVAIHAWLPVPIESSNELSLDEVWDEVDEGELDDDMVIEAGTVDVSDFGPGAYYVFTWGCEKEDFDNCSWQDPYYFHDSLQVPAIPVFEDRDIEAYALEIDLEVEYVDEATGSATKYVVVFAVDDSRWYVGGVLSEEVEQLLQPALDECS